MLDFTSKVLTLFKADTSDMKAGLKELQGEEKKLAQAQLDAANQRNAGYEQWIKKLGDVNQAIELVGKGVAFARDSFRAYSEDLRLRAAAGTVSIEKLRAASLGLRTEHELLSFAAKTQHGVFKVTEEQMVTAQKAMVALTREGHDQAKVLDKVTEALVKGKAEGFDDFGIAVRKGTSDAENFRNMMDALALKASGVKDGTHVAGEGIQALGVSMQDSLDKMKKSIGELVASLAPLMSGLAEAIRYAAELVNMLPKGTLSGGGTGIGTGALGPSKVAQGLAALRAAGLAKSPVAPGEPAWSSQGDGTVDQATFFTWSNGVLQMLPRPPKRTGPRPRGDVSQFADITGFDGSRRVSNIRNFLTGDTASTSLGQAAGYEDSTRAYLDHLTKVQEAQQRTKDWMAQLSSAGADAVAKDMDRLQRFTDLTTSAYESIVSGSASATQALKSMAQQHLLAFGKREVVEAISQTAMGFGALANPLFAGAAAMHFKSAATHAAAAAAAGVGVALVGGIGGGGGNVAARSGAPGSSNAGSGTSSNQRPTVINYIITGDNHADDSPRIKQRNAKRMVDMASTKTSVGGSF